jgi:gamma-glutamyltranspeptidase/glutathione hydrolase
MVSLIQSNYMGFGSGIVVPGTGVSLHNRGAGFSLSPGHPNLVGPKKRPLHTIIPGFTTDDAGHPLMAFGFMGGPMQAQGHVQMVLRVHRFHQDPQAAVDAPRWRVLRGRRVIVEPSMPTTTVQELRALGHEVAVSHDHNHFEFGGAQLIVRSGNGYLAGSDRRKDGCALAW